MSSEYKPSEKPFEYPMMPIFDMGIGRELGSIDSRLTRVENDIVEVKAELKAIDAKFTAKADKMANALHRLDERTKHLESKFNISIALTGAVLAAVIAGLILQYLK